MAESVASTARGTEISERSAELVLPESDSSVSSASLAKSLTSILGRTKVDRSDNVWSDNVWSDGGSAKAAPAIVDSAEMGWRKANRANASPSKVGQPKEGHSAVCDERKIGVSNPEATYGHVVDKRSASASDVAKPEELPPEQRGRPLPGDRGRERHEAPKQRPSFWRRIALGRRAAKAEPDSPVEDRKQMAPAKSVLPSTAQNQSDSVERRVVEPLLQALVSVESKLERSHLDLVGRSDQIEQRLTQLWDIEEQLGTLGELQESLLQVSEQQRRLESALVTQNRTLRWLVGAVLFALAAAAFVVAAVLR